MALLSFEHIDKRFLAVHALQDVSLEVHEGSILGLIGENGAGKSTLMNVLGGVIQPSSGRMLLDGVPFVPAGPADATNTGIAFIHQELNLFTNLSIRDNLFIDRFPSSRIRPLIGMSKLTSRTEALLRQVGLDLNPETLVEQLSPGERQLVEIARALRLDARILILDEPTTSLAGKETDHLFSLIRELRDEGVAIIYISHTLTDVLSLADRVAVLRDGAIVDQGDAASFDIDRMIGAMVGRSLGALFPERRSQRRDDVVLRVNEVTQPGIVEDISFDLRAGEIVGLFGLMGSGRTELARILFGLEPMQSGDVRIDGHSCRDLPTHTRIRQGMAFVTEDRRGDGLLMEASVLENVSLASLDEYARTWLRLLKKSDLKAAVGEITESLRIKVDDIGTQPVRNLSGGNQQKTVIGRWLLSRPTVFILDEPTRGIDIGAKQEVYALIARLAEDGAGVLLVSSEVEELIGMCDRVLVMARGKISGVFERGDFDQQHFLRAAFQEESHVA